MVVLLATITAGLMAGLFFAYSVSVMLALGEVDDVAFVDVMRRINRRIVNGVFLLAFLGSLLASTATIVVDLVNGGDADLLAMLGAAVFLLSLVITFAVNIPMNNRLDAAGTVDHATASNVRRAFEGPWVRWNHLRTLTSTAGFVLLCVAKN